MKSKINCIQEKLLYIVYLDTVFPCEFIQETFSINEKRVVPEKVSKNSEIAKPSYSLRKNRKFLSPNATKV